MRYACITRHVGAYPVRLMCRVLAVAPAGYYAWRRRTSPTAHAIADEALMAQVRVAHAASGGTYGAPRVHQELRAAGVRVAKKRVARVMQTAGLRGRSRRRRVTTTIAAAAPVAPNTLARQFAVASPARGVNRVWVSDITYVRTRAGWLYLAVVLDLASRRVVGWAMRDTLATELVVSALQLALGTRRPERGLVHHSDRGIQYASADYQALLAAHGIAASMSRKGNCWDNAVAESFFATLKREVPVSVWPTPSAARVALVDYIERWYNRQRRHSALGYHSPVAFEAACAVA